MLYLIGFKIEKARTIQKQKEKVYIHVILEQVAWQLVVHDTRHISTLSREKRVLGLLLKAEIQTGISDGHMKEVIPSLISNLSYHVGPDGKRLYYLINPHPCWLLYVGCLVLCLITLLLYCKILHILLQT